MINIHRHYTLDKRIVYKELPQKFKALIVQKIQNTSVTNQTVEANTCIECTLLGDRGLSMTNYCDTLFERHCVLRFVSKSKRNLIVDHLS